MKTNGIMVNSKSLRSADKYSPSTGGRGLGGGGAELLRKLEVR
jgi:hypothetical protein